MTAMLEQPTTMPRLLTDDDCYNALLARDARVDGRVYFAITSTGIYCRPVCPARKPLRKNVRYYLSADAAERAGFRACKRCRPKEAPHDPAMDLVERACRDVHEHLDGDCSLQAIGLRLGVSPHHLQRTFKAMLGVSPKAYVAARRVDRFKTAVRDGLDVTSALYDAGYGSSSRLYERADAELGMTPGAYRDRGKATRIAYAVADSPLGTLLVAATDKGLCAVRLGNSAGALVADLDEEFSAAEISADDGALATAIERILANLAGGLPAIDLPLDVRATAFQRRVWEALRAIPRGETRSYRQVAEAIGSPAAVRAVASACASNPVALVVPCHRVIRSDGGMGGYRWGVERKVDLLRREANG
jgi:AraC family transcriptional regulator of adaptative response/methylated-DNA-[protein]-cysteine methyltransferase